MNPETPDFSNVRSGNSSVPASSPDFSNVQGGTSAVQGGGGTGTQREPQHYTVQKGDTLSHIAKHFYGNASRWHAIYDANRDQLDDPDLIRPGQVLLVPASDDHA
ncbi:LysM peptidoglycan-binding domain-containing protein [Cognatilysobacter lacus]|uniref:LysM peptidoglycan-binding domain-containing protein n=1 Tax=Cognatilysobacter lacus TaxID=1643323 RepID=A0A5D8Z7W8_9GAMM|nr:LysM peptidoglycan-binding domain-containing protein [Lysobacter lacus]TZF90636.1 LysM peptidoglycan-binding domain-containing protein [Lysobacter lacus]